MKMRAKVVISYKTAFAVLTEYGYTVFNSDDDISIKDILVGDLNTHASETLFNETTNSQVEVFIEGIHCSKQHALKLINDIA